MITYWTTTLIYRIIGVLLTVFASTYYSATVCRAKKQRVKELRLLAALVNDFAGEIRYRSKETKRLLEESLCMEKYAPLKKLDYNVLALSKDETQTAKAFFERLGKSGRSAELNYCKEFYEKMKSLADEAEKALPASIKVTNAVGFFGGIFLSLLIL